MFILAIFMDFYLIQLQSRKVLASLFWCVRDRARRSSDKSEVHIRSGFARYRIPPVLDSLNQGYGRIRQCYILTRFPSMLATFFRNMSLIFSILASSYIHIQSNKGTLPTTAYSSIIRQSTCLSRDISLILRC